MRTSGEIFTAIGLDPSAFANARGFVFDFGGVISNSPFKRWEKTLYPRCAAEGLDRAALDRGWRRHRHLWDGGFISFEEFYRKVFADEGRVPSRELLDFLWEADAVGWIDELRPETLELMTALKREGRKIGVLTNMSGDFFARLYVPRCAAHRALLDGEVVSGLEKLYKPERAIYDLMASRMDLAPRELVFFDDTLKNVEAARALGWGAELYPAQSPGLNRGPDA